MNEKRMQTILARKPLRHRANAIIHAWDMAPTRDQRIPYVARQLRDALGSAQAGPFTQGELNRAAELCDKLRLPTDRVPHYERVDGHSATRECLAWLRGRLQGVAE